MKYLLLKRRPRKEIAEENFFFENVSAMDANEPDPGLPFTIEGNDLNDAQAAEAQRDPEIEDVIPSIPLTLIAPLEDSEQELRSRRRRGVSRLSAPTLRPRMEMV